MTVRFSLWPLVVTALALAVSAGCGSPTDVGDTSSTTTEAPIAETPSASVDPEPVEGTWTSLGIARADFRRALARHGLGEHAEAFATKAGLGRSVDLTLEVSEKFWTLYVGMDGQAGGLADRGTYELQGQRVVVQPNSGGKNVFRWTVTGNELALTLVSTTEPPYEGVPAEVFQSGYYATNAFTRDPS